MTEPYRELWPLLDWQSRWSRAGMTYIDEILLHCYLDGTNVGIRLCHAQVFFLNLRWNGWRAVRFYFHQWERDVGLR